MEVAMKQLLRGPTGRWVFSSLIVVAACSSADRPTAPRNRPQFDISDAAHLAGTAGFFFLPPIVALTAVTGMVGVDMVVGTRLDVWVVVWRGRCVNMSR